MLSITPPIKINACCGDRPRSGYVNIDIVASADGGPAPDIVCNALSVPLPDGCAEEIMCIHGFEHFYRWECDNLVLEWKRLLMPGGRLVLELPDLLKCCQNILAELEIPGRNPDQSGMWGLYGDPRLGSPFMGHRWGWSPKTLRRFLKGHGFIDITDAVTQFHPAGRQARDMRIEAVRP